MSDKTSLSHLLSLWQRIELTIRTWG